VQFRRRSVRFSDSEQSRISLRVDVRDHDDANSEQIVVLETRTVERRRPFDALRPASLPPLSTAYDALLLVGVFLPSSLPPSLSLSLELSYRYGTLASGQRTVGVNSASNWTRWTANGLEETDAGSIMHR